MANSDNVIRAGLTPKLRDIPNLVNTLTYAAAPVSHHRVKPLPFSVSLASTLYDPPIPEFSVVNTTLTPGQTEGHHSIDGPSIAIVAGGKGKLQWSSGSLDVVRGEAIFVGAKIAIDIFAAGEEDEKFEIYRAFVEV
jgi:mannose-6-phosphate isomerase